MLYHYIHTAFFNILDTDITGYISSLSPIRIAKSKTKYFDFLLHTKKDVKRAVCFSPEKYQLIEQINADTKQGCQIKKVKLNKDSKDVVIGTNSSIKKMDLEFQKIENTPEYKKIDYLINEAMIFDVVDVRGIIANLGPTETTEIDGVQIEYCTASLTDDTGSIPVTFFGASTINLKEKQCYEITNLKLNVFKARKLLKSTDRTKLIIITDHNIIVTDDQLVDDRMNKITATIISLDMKSFTEIYTCSSCKAEIVPDDDDFFMCQNCDTMAVIEDCVMQKNLKFTVLTTDTRQKIDLVAAHRMLKNIL